jgi:predicted ATP-dependent endonuclease of OLD family
MIVGILLRNFKTYTNINYIPITGGHGFCGLVGINGIGKSSVLEAINCLLNDKNWNFNVVVKRRGIATTKPYIVPLYLIPINKISSSNLSIAKKISHYVWNVDKSDINPTSHGSFTTFQKQRELLKKSFNEESYLLIPLGRSYDQTPSLSIFNTKNLTEILLDQSEHNNQVPDRGLNEIEPLLEPLLLQIKSLFEYIYIPKDVDPENFTQLENEEIQSLMGETLNEIVEKHVPQSKIQEINKNLTTFLDSLSTILGDYSFRTTGERQVKLRKNDVYKLIIDAFFKIRKLHKKEGEHWLELNVLSSGEKQKAIIELAFQFLKEYRIGSENVIIAIDEPESSLHMSACYDQFTKLFEISSLCTQLLFTTHWYGFIPTIENGYVNVISKTNNGHDFDLINISSYRESIKQSTKNSKGQLPFDIRLKSSNDFVQSIITSILGDQPFNWLICEGSSDKIYFEAYLADIIKEKKLRIIPVGGANEIKKLYNYLQVAYEDFKNVVKGKVILISDTDSQLVQYPTKDEYTNLISYRIVNDDSKSKTILVKNQSNQVSPKTEIEDCLNGRLFFETLKEYETDNSELSPLIKEVNEPTEESTYFALDLPLTKQKILEIFFDKGNHKFEFAKKYCEKVNMGYKVPDWIEELKRRF